MTTLNIERNDEFIDSLADSLVNSETKSLNERIGSNTVDLLNYLKHDGGKGRITGKALLLNKIQNLCIIDVDINKSYNDELKDQVRKQILSKLSDEDVIVKTGSGGLHIYCNTEFFEPTSNRMIKCYSCSDYDIDLMTSIDESKRSLIVMADSRVRKNAREKICAYEFVRGGYDSKITRSLSNILNDLDITIKVQQTEEINNIIKENQDVVLSDELAQALIDGIADFEVHNDGGNIPLSKEVTLFTLFQAINSLPKKFIDEAYNNAYQFCKLTDNARNNFDNKRSRFSHLSTSPFVLAKILKLYQTEYYEEYVKPFMSHAVKRFNINLNDDFSMTDIRRKVERNLYKHSSEIIEDLSKVIRFIDSGTKMFIQKEYDIHSKTWSLVFVNNTSMKESLKMIKLGNDGKKTITAYDVLLTKLTSLTVKGVAFNSSDKDVLSIFHGYKYNVLNKINHGIIEQFIDFIREIICNNDNEAFSYVIGWIASMVQNPGIKNETALVLKGLQGVGKNRFTDILCELLAGYSERNINEIEELTGNFNSIVENKMLLVLNEMKNNGEDRMVNFNSLKSKITDNTIRINEKFQPRHTAENVANFIFCTNNAFPVKIEAGDRRYVVLQVSGKYKGQFNYFKSLMNSCTKDFYDNLLTFFMNYDLSSFNVRDIPMTEAKQDIINASKSPIDQFICDHYDDLVKGMICSDALMYKPSDMKDKNFQLQLKDKCDRKKKGPKGNQKWCYILKDECKSLYKQTINSDLTDDYDEFMDSTENA